MSINAQLHIIIHNVFFFLSLLVFWVFSTLCSVFRGVFGFRSSSPFYIFFHTTWTGFIITINSVEFWLFEQSIALLQKLLQIKFLDHSVFLLFTSNKWWTNDFTFCLFLNPKRTDKLKNTFLFYIGFFFECV